MSKISYSTESYILVVMVIYHIASDLLKLSLFTQHISYARFGI